MGWGFSRIRGPSAGVGRRNVHNFRGDTYANHGHLSELPMFLNWTPFL